MAEPTGDKTLDATPHRRRQAREAGHVARSGDVASAILLFGAVVVLLWLGRSLVDFLGNLTVRQLSGEPWLAADIPFVTHIVNGLLVSLAAALLPVLGLIMLLAIVGHLVQVGFLFLPDKALPDFSRIDPVQGLARLFSLRTSSRLAIGLLKLAAVTVVAWYSFQADRDRILHCGQLPLADLAVFIAETAIWTALRIGLALLALAALDYAYERLRYERDLRMTAQEMREELRSLNGDPHLISRRRTLRRQFARSRVASDVAQADLVIARPRGLAVAVRYNARLASAPIVAAKGVGPAAARIRAWATEHHVPVVEQPALTQSLYGAVEVNRPIPPRLYPSVAQLLARMPAAEGFSAMPTSPVA
jgi:flagellar biosynthetic protein FlhB